ncbi:helix-turn-helix transcriptional regulator [Streptomyces sp. NPDC093084]|uniref:helix-turn-helix domain-containing protein n=1 Tax=Streptomyces sp. NPDC093084 TaxID=3155197 RepID=UPI00341A12BE
MSKVVGLRLRELRRAKGQRLIDVAKAGVVGSAPTLSRIETGSTPLKEEVVLGLARFYGSSEEELDSLQKLMSRNQGVDWYEEFRDVIPYWVERLISAESSAQQIRTYEAQFVPGLLQNAAYAKALLQHGRPVTSDLGTDLSDEQIERRVEVRQRRGNILKGSQGPEYYAVLDEAVLARPIGGNAVMKSQLRDLYNYAENYERIGIRVLPFSTGDEVMAPASAITYLGMASGPEDAMVYLEVRYGGSYLTAPDLVELYQLALANLWHNAASRVETLNLLQKYIDRL